MLGLLRARDFALLWIGETTSTVGTAVTTVALPLVAISELNAGTFSVAALSAATWSPWLVFGLPAGAIVDRRRRRPVMLACDAVSMVLFASIPIAAWYGILHLTQLFVVAIGAGIAAVFFTTAYTAYLPHILAPRDRDEGNAKIFGSSSAANLVGPSLAGIIARVFGAATAMLADAVSFLVSAICLSGIRKKEPDQDERAPTTLRRDMIEGIRYASADPYLRSLTLWGGLANLSLTATQSVVVLFLIRTVGVDSAVAGLALAAGSIGGITGAATAAALCRRFGTARGLLLCEIGTAPFGLLVPLTHRGFGLSLIVIGTIIPAAGRVAGNVIQRGFTQNYCPTHLQGRLAATQAVFNYGTMPLGGLAGGALGAAIGVRETLWISASLLVAVGIILLLSPVRHRKDLPSHARNLPGNERLDRRAL